MHFLLLLNYIPASTPSRGIPKKLLLSKIHPAPGLLAFIYKLRWDVEKTFDQVKNLFGEKNDECRKQGSAGGIHCIGAQSGLDA